MSPLMPYRSILLFTAPSSSGGSQAQTRVKCRKFVTDLGRTFCLEAEDCTWTHFVPIDDFKIVDGISN
jgi:hypothetical protein